MARRAHIRIFGFGVRFELMFFLVAGFLVLSGGSDLVSAAIALAILTASILFHELGHAFAYRHYGAHPSISLHGFGGLTYGHGSGHLTAAQRIVVSSAGSLATIILIGAPTYAAIRYLEPVGTTRSILNFVLFINLAWGLINLVPIVPLDGGQILYDGLLLATKEPQRTIVHWVSVVLALALAIWFWTSGQTFAVILFGYLAFSNLNSLGIFAGGDSTPLDEVLSTPPGEGPRTQNTRADPES